MTPEEVLKDIEKNPESFMIIGPQKGQVLANLIEKYKPESILEIGTNLGYSAILMASHLTKKGKVTTLELQKQTAQKAQENINKAGLEEKITIVVGDAKETISKLNQKYDFVFIDAAKKQYLTYLKLIEDKILPQTVVVADNVGRFRDEVADYLQYVKKGGTYESQTVEIGDDALEISIFKS